MPTFPVSTGTLITNAAYNDLSAIVQEVVGVGENGYGLYDFWTTPITDTMPIRGKSWDNLIKDLVNNCYHHITNINTTTNTYSSILPSPKSVPGTVISSDLHNDLNTVAQYVLANRYTCAEEQFYVDPTTGAKVNFTGGSSERTIPWGVTPRYIEQHVRIRWANRLVARYFFNTGGYLTWQPYHLNNGLSGTIDQDWADFILSIRTAQLTSPVKYDRAAFLAQNAGTTSTFASYTQGTLYVNLEVFKASNSEYVDFMVTFGNTDTPLLVVEPTVGYWNEIV